MLIDNMKAENIRQERTQIAETAFIDVVIWHVPAPLAGSSHRFKYRLDLIADGRCVLRYDNEAGKGDHKHFGRKQVAYNFKNLDQLRIDFDADVTEWLRRIQI